MWVWKKKKKGGKEGDHHEELCSGSLPCVPLEHFGEGVLEPTGKVGLEEAQAALHLAQLLLNPAQSAAARMRRGGKGEEEAS